MNLKKYNDRLNKATSVMELSEYLEKAKTDSYLYASPQERLLKAIGEPELFDTSTDFRYKRIFGNRVIKRYKAFSEFFGLESVIEKIVNYLSFAAQNLEERKQILYLFGPPGSAKSSLAEHLKTLFEQEPFYALAIEDENGLQISPIHESPLGLFTKADAEDLGLPERLFDLIPSPWAVKRLDVMKDITKFKVVKLYPSSLRQIAIAKTEPGDDNNQDISTLVGKLDIRKLEHFAQDDPDAYRFSGGLCLANRGILDFVEMFKAPINVLHPLLEATQGKNYKATESLPPIPFDGIIIAHSNEAEWETFRNNKSNEAFLDRIYLVKVPYCLSITEEKQIYRKQLNLSSLSNAPCVDHVLDILAKFAIMTRFDSEDDSNTYDKLRVYDGQPLKDKEPKSKSFIEYKDLATPKEGFIGLSTRAAFKLLSQTFNYDVAETAADPVHMLLLIKNYVRDLDLPDEQEAKWLAFRSTIMSDYVHKLGKDVYSACLESYEEIGQHQFNKYIMYADNWLQGQDYRDPDTGQMFNQEMLDQELRLLERPAGIANSKDFRHEVVEFSLRHRANKGGKNPSWKAYQKMRDVIEASLFKDIDKVLGILSFDETGSKDQQKKTSAFIKEMQKKGYTALQAERNLKWFNRIKESK